MQNTIRQNYIFFIFLFKRFFFNWGFLASIICLSIFYTVFLSFVYLSDAFRFVIAPGFFLLNLFILGIALFNYKKSKDFFYDKKLYNFWIIICLLIFDFILMLTIIFWTWFFYLIDQLILKDSYGGAYSMIFPSNVNWFVFYYFIILLALISFFYFEILYKFIKKQKNYNFIILFIFMLFFVSAIHYFLFVNDYINVSPEHYEPPSSFSYQQFPKWAIFNDSSHQLYDPSTQTLYIYPTLFWTGQKSAGGWLIFLINPFIVLQYLIKITTLNYTYSYPFYVYNGHIIFEGQLTFKIVYFHIELWSGYFWFMFYPYLYVLFLFLIKIYTNKIFTL